MKKALFTLIITALCITAISQDGPKNVILLIGDGMGPEQVRTLQYIKGGEPGVMTQFPFSGWSRTYSLSDSITDSAAGGSALSTGKKTINHYVACNADGSANETLLEWAEKRGKATGIVVTVPITNATPADFYAHVTSRKMEEEIARQLVYSGIDFAVGGYRNYFLPNKRKDGQNLIDSLTARNYQVVGTTEEVAQLQQLPAVGLLTDKNPPRAAGRGNWTEVAVNKALQLLSTDEDGFFLMIEGSQIDWGCHANNFNYMCGELLDFDRAVKIAYEFAQSHPNTLVIVTADHETGGLHYSSNISKVSAEPSQQKVRKYAHWKKFYHTKTNVPVYAFGPRAELFQGTMENIDIHAKILQIWK